MPALLIVALFLQEVPDLIDRLGSPSVEQREEARRELEELGDRAIPDLRRALGHRDPEVVLQARGLLEALEIRKAISADLEKAIPGVRERLSRADLQEWTRVFLEVADPRYDRLGPDDRDPLVVRALRGAGDADELARVEALAREYGCRSAVGELFSMLRDPQCPWRGVVLSSLVAFGDESLMPEGLAMLESGEGEVRLQGALLIGSLGERAPFAELRARLEHDRPEVRAAALGALGATRREEAVPGIVKGCGDSSPNVRIAAVLASMRHKSPRLVHGLVMLLNDEYPVVRVTTVRALKWIGSSEAVDPLARHLFDPEPGMRLRVVDALGALNGRRHAGKIGGLVGDLDPDIRAKAIWALARVGDAESGKAILPALKAEEDAIRFDAVHALAILDTGGYADAIAGLLKDPHPVVRARAAEAVGRSRKTAHGDALIPLLKDRHPCVRGYAAEALGRLRHAWAEKALVGLLQDTKEIRMDLLHGAHQPLGRPVGESELYGDWGKVPFKIPVGNTAAVALCRSGSRKGVERILQARDDAGFPRDDFSLNAVRNPNAWQALSEVKFEGDDWPSGDEICRQVATVLKLPIREKRPMRGLGHWRRETGSEPPSPKGTPLSEVAGEVLRQWPTTRIVIESDHVRLVGYQESRSFWKKWWADGGKPIE